MSYDPIHFSRSEFDCNCGCGLNNISDDLLIKLDVARGILEAPIYVISGCRCPKHNHDSGGSNTSSHLSGLAADLTSESMWNLRTALEEAGIKRIGIMVASIHGDIDPNKPAPVLWGYGNG